MKFKEWMKGCEVMNTFTNVQGSCVITYKYPTYFLLAVKLQCCRPLDNFSIASFWAWIGIQRSIGTKLILKEGLEGHIH
jgi:hypothetical protein